MPTFKTHQDFLDKIAALRDSLARGLSPQISQNPQLAEQLTGYLDSQFESWLASEQALPASPDGGLAQLIGLGPGASDDIGAAPIALPVQVYDEAVTSERINAVADIYYFYQHERLGVFRALAKLQELFKAGSVRLSSGKGAFKLYQFDRKEVLRYTRKDRLSAYRRVLGYGNGQIPPGARPNTEFHKLFSHFIEQVTLFWRDKRVSDVIRTRANDPSFGSIAIVRRSGLDLRNNLKWQSYGNLNVMRVELMELLREAFDILGSEDVRNLFGASTVWDVIEEILVRYFNEQLSTSPRQRMAVAGRSIVTWLASTAILQSRRIEFETSLTQIAEDAEEWFTSAQALGLASRDNRVRVTPFSRMPRQEALGCPAGLPRVAR